MEREEAKDRKERRKGGRSCIGVAPVFVCHGFKIHTRTRALSLFHGNTGKVSRLLPANRRPAPEIAHSTLLVQS